MPCAALQVDEEHVVVLVRNEALGHDAVHAHRAREHGHEHDHHRDAVTQHEAEAPLVAVEHRVEGAIEQAGQAPLGVHDAQEPAAQHRRQRDRDDAGNENRRRDRDGELAEQPAQDARS